MYAELGIQSLKVVFLPSPATRHVEKGSACNDGHLVKKKCGYWTRLSFNSGFEKVVAAYARGVPAP